MCVDVRACMLRVEVCVYCLLKDEEHVFYSFCKIAKFHLFRSTFYLLLKASASELHLCIARVTVELSELWFF